MNVLVVGASGAIGNAVINAFLERFYEATVYAVSRAELVNESSRVINVSLDSSQESQVADWLAECQAQRIAFTHVVCCTGTLHDAEVTPEKRLEEVSPEALQHYFAVNTIIPMNWIKHLVNCFPNEHSTLTLLSARVGSIDDNRLGGWYGYRASKAALNMLVKTAAVEYARRARQTSLICYHPGTVDSALSEPFQRNVKPEKLFSPDFTASQLIEILCQTKAENSPFFLDWAGKPIAW